MNADQWLFQATIADLESKQDEVFEMPLWERSDYLAGEQALGAIANEFKLRRVWAE